MRSQRAHERTHGHLCDGDSAPVLKVRLREEQLLKRRAIQRLRTHKTNYNLNAATTLMNLTGERFGDRNDVIVAANNSIEGKQPQ